MSDNKQRRADALQQLSRELKRRDRAEKAKPLSVVAASLAIILVICGGIWFAATRSETADTDNTASSATTSAAATTSEAPTTYAAIATTRSNPLPATVTCAYPADGTAAKDAGLPPTENIPATGTVTVTLNTSQGDIPMTLDRAVSPCTVNAITYLASKGYYNDTVCHRLTTSGIHVLQCGDPSGTGAGGPGFKFNNEFPTDEAAGSTEPVNYGRGTIAMANAGNDTNGSQFFLDYGDSPLPPNYTYFGQIGEAGLATLDKIAANGTQDGSADGTPAQEVRITAAQVA